MEKLPLSVPDLIRGLDEVFKEEDTLGVLGLLRTNKLEFYLGTRAVIDYLKRLEQEEMES